MSVWLTGVLVACGVLFFAAGTLGLIRFPDVHSRLHALTKADNLGLGCIAAGVALQAPSLAIVVKLMVIWLLVLVAAAAVAQLIARAALSDNSRRRKRGDFNS